jgi:hypothetical protein
LLSIAWNITATFLKPGIADSILENPWRDAHIAVKVNSKRVTNALSRMTFLAATVLAQRFGVSWRSLLEGCEDIPP